MRKLGMYTIASSNIALGLFFYVPTNLIPLAGEGTMLCISENLDSKICEKIRE